jgi:hypothetical protein
MEQEKLLAFILKAHQNTYAAPKEIKLKHKSKIPILKGHDDYDFSEGDLSYHDSYAGIQWAPGREVVFFKGNPVWSMAYQGRTIEGLSKEFVEELFGFLKEALRTIDASMPFRGPKKYTRGNYEYTFTMKGDYGYFTGRESITFKGKEVFFQDVMGSLIK